VRFVVADTTPLNYLLLIDHIDLLPELFETVRVPDIVRDELTAAGAPPVVQAWISSPPVWLIVDPTPALTTTTANLDAGERAATAVARAQGFTVMGTLGVLELAAKRGMIDLRASLSRLTATNFRIGSRLIDALLAKYPSGQ
jgi:predicted nucleic acid-binding protein